MNINGNLLAVLLALVLPGGNAMDAERLRLECLKNLAQEGYARRSDWPLIVGHPTAPVELWKRHVLEQVVFPFPFYPLPERNEVAGRIALGKVLRTGATIGLEPEALHSVGGLCLSGGMGTGKSTLIARIAAQYPGAVLLLDFASEMSGLVRYDPRFVVLHYTDIRIPPFILSGVKHDERAFGLQSANILAASENLFEGSQHVLEKLYLRTAARLGTYRVPFEEALREALSMRIPVGTEGQYFLRVRNRFEGIWHGLNTLVAGDACFTPHLLNQRIILQGAPSSMANRRVYVSTLFAHLIELQTLLPGLAPMLISVPEASVYFPRTKAELRPPFLDSYLTTRKRRITVAVDIQLVHQLDQWLASNMRHLALRNNDPNDAQELKSYLSLTNQQMDTLRQLPRGHAIINHPNWAAPLPMVAAPLPMHSVSTEWIESRRRLFFEHRKWNPPPVEDPTPIDEEVISGPATKEPDQDTPGPPIPQGRTLELLQSACRFPFRLVSEHQRLLNWGGSAFQKAAQDLRPFATLIKFVPLVEGTKGHPGTWLSPTEEAFRVCHVSVPHWIGRLRQGDGLHYFWQIRVAEHLKASNAGARALIDREVNGKRADVSLQVPGEPPLAVEIQLTLDTLISNVRDNDKAGFKRQLVLVPERGLLEKGKGLVAKELPKLCDRVEWDVLGNYRDVQEGGDHV
jgi:hypothetical protein